MSKITDPLKNKRVWPSVATPGAKQGRKRHHLAKVKPGIESDNDLVSGRDARTLFMHAAGFSWKDLARAEGVTEGAIGQRIRRARAVIAIDEVYLEGVRRLIALIPKGIDNLEGFITGIHPVTEKPMPDKNGQNRWKATAKLLDTAGLTGDRLKPHNLAAAGGGVEPLTDDFGSMSETDVDRMLLEQTTRISTTLKAKLKKRKEAQPIEADYSIVPLDSADTDNSRPDGGTDDAPPIADI